MTLSSVVLFLITATVFGSYAWGMRGTTIGGEKGAMLPGAVIGLSIALFSGIPVFRENFLLLSAYGAVAMYFGGSMTYGETLSLSMDKNRSYNLRRGLVALFVKGFLWFGVFGGLFSTGIAISAGLFSRPELIILLVLVPVSAIVFYCIFNFPINAEKGIFPKIYFSLTRKESWGALFGMYAVLLGTGIAKMSVFIIIFSLLPAVFGAVGWVLGQLCQIYCKHQAKDSKHRLFSFLGGEYTDSWKLMECLLGAFGGLGSAIAVICAYDDFKALGYHIEMNGVFSPISSVVSDIILYVWITLLAADMISFFIKEPLIKSDLKAKFKSKKISLSEYKELSKTALKEMPKKLIRYRIVTNYAESVLYAAIPFLLLTFGQINAPALISFFLIFWVLMQEVAFEREKKPIFRLPYQIIAGIIGLAIIIYEIVTAEGVPDILLIILYGVVYEIVSVIWITAPKSLHRCAPPEVRLKDLLFNSSVLTVHSYFAICIIFSTVVLLFR